VQVVGERRWWLGGSPPESRICGRCEGLSRYHLRDRIDVQMRSAARRRDERRLPSARLLRFGSSREAHTSSLSALDAVLAKHTRITHEHKGARFKLRTRPPDQCEEVVELLVTLLTFRRLGLCGPLMHTHAFRSRLVPILTGSRKRSRRRRRRTRNRGWAGWYCRWRRAGSDSPRTAPSCQRRTPTHPRRRRARMRRST
jgi:hypothetical protein